MATIRFAAIVPAGAVVRVYDRHDNSFIGETTADGSGETAIATDYDVMRDFLIVIASEEPENNVELTPTNIEITP
jgi:hypothetical protein